jgi:hypothetical protein
MGVGVTAWLGTCFVGVGVVALEPNELDPELDEGRVTTR